MASLIVGVLVATWLQDSAPRAAAIAQETTRSGYVPVTPVQQRGAAVGKPGRGNGKLNPAAFPGEEDEPAPAPVGISPEELAEMTPEERVHVLVYERANRSVVHITTRGTAEGRLFDSTTEGSGSGNVLDTEGHILTNYHVIEGANEATVTLFDGSQYDAVLVGEDPPNDVAVIKIKAPPDKLFPVPLGDSSKLRVGMRVYAIGNPFGLERTLTTGIISSLDRTLQVDRVRKITSIIQIDAAVNPGSSGGPLLNTRGQLIGVNTAIASRTGQSAGVGFAIPANLIRRVVPQLIRHGRVIRADVGIVKVYQTGRGLLVLQTVPGGPADRAGVRGPTVVTKRRGPLTFQTTDRSTADLIVGVDGNATNTAAEFLAKIDERSPGDVITLNIVRQGRPQQVPVTLGEQPRAGQ
jgi:S1-C subfamily serine protease